MREETDITSTKNMLHPALFPLLLLISRLQPISLSRVDPSANDISNMFIEPVINCIGHVHQKVRIVAARALAVLCTGDDDKGIRKNSSRTALIEKCTTLLSRASHDMVVDHNQDHGALLALKCLLGNCSKPQMHFNETLKNMVFYYCTWGHFTATCPPVCAVIALEIWQYVNEAEDDDFELPPNSNEEEQKEAKLQDITFKVVQYVESVSRSGQSVIGLAALGSHAARIAIKTSYPIIFNLVDSNSNYLLEKVKNLICSDCYDVMLHSVKSFKKNICDSVDAIIENTSATLNSRITTLQSICKMLISSLFFLLDRDGSSSHPPTIRRLSRCIIETLIGYKSLSKYTHLTDMTEYSLPQVFQKFATILAFDSEEASIGCIGGNAIELMGLTIPELYASIDDNYTSQNFDDDLSLFLRYIGRSIDPKTSWKVRYSAAISTKESELLTFQIDDPNASQSITERCRMELRFQMIVLLQDGDEDVRKAAARALLSDRANPSASLRSLEMGYEQECGKASDHGLFTMLLKQIICQTQNIEIDLGEMINEFNYTIGIKDLSQIQNLHTGRKIFEEENLNTFEEVSVFSLNASIPLHL